LAWGRKGFAMLTSSMGQFSARRIAAAVAVAFFAAAVFVQFDATPRAAASAGVAGTAMMRLLSDEHAAIAGYLQQEAEARTQADQSAAHDLERMKLAALEEAQPAPLRLAQAPVRQEKPKVSLVRVAAKPESVRAANQVAVSQATPVAASEPMQLLAMTDAEAMQAPRPPGLVRGRVNRLASTVERIPSWFNAAAGWVVETVPAPRMPSLPLVPRHFRV
jgi:hypothetical protein